MAVHRHRRLGLRVGWSTSWQRCLEFDAFAGGLVVQSLLALWLFQTFGLSLAVTAQLFFWSNPWTAVSYLAAAPLARRIGLINTMVFTYLPANLCLVAVPFVTGLWQAIALLLRSSSCRWTCQRARLTSWPWSRQPSAGRGQPDGGTPQPRRPAKPEPCRLDAGRSHVRLAVPARRRFEDSSMTLALLARFRHNYRLGGAAAVITASKDAFRPRVPRAQARCRRPRRSASGLAAALGAQAVQIVGTLPGQPIVAHCARVRAMENGDGERSKEEQPRGQKAQGQQEERSRVDRHCVHRARQTEARGGEERRARK